MWLLIASFVAVSEASKDIFHSQPRVRPLSPVLKAWVVMTASLPFVAVALLVTGIPRVESSFWSVVVIHVILSTTANVLYMRALALGPLSQTQPILSLTTVLLIVTTPLMTRDQVTIWGWIGVVAVSIGIYATQYPGRDPKTGMLPSLHAPFVEMVRQPGVLSKLGVAIIFSVTANLDKMALERGATGPFYLVVDLALISLLLGIILLVLKARGATLVGQPIKDSAGQSISIAAPQYLLIGGFNNAITILLHMWALTLVPVPFVIAVKRISIILTSLWGYLVRKERAPHWYRLVGMLAVVLGVVLILLLGSESANGTR